MMELIMQHWASILVIVTFIVAIIFFAVRGKKQIIYKMLDFLVDEAEKLYGAGTGNIKFAEVLTKVYSMLPAIVKVFITYDTLAKWIEEAVAKMKERIDEKAKAE